MFSRSEKNWFTNSVNNLNLLLEVLRPVEVEKYIEEYSATERYSMNTVSTAGSNFDSFIKQVNDSVSKFQKEFTEKMTEKSKKFKRIDRFNFSNNEVCIHGLKTRLIEKPLIDHYKKYDFDKPIEFHYSSNNGSTLKQNNVESEDKASVCLKGALGQELHVEFKGITIIVDLNNLQANKGVFIRKLLQKKNLLDFFFFIKAHKSLIPMTVIKKDLYEKI